MRGPVRYAALVLVATGLGLLAWGLWIPAKAVLAQHLLEVAWQRTQAGEQHVKPWPWADIAPAWRLTLPEHARSYVVLQDVSGEAMAFGPGHVPNTVTPGEPGIAVIGGHRDTHFAILESMYPGQHILIEDSQGNILTFTVREVTTRNVADASLVHNGHSAILVLVTCYPFDAVLPGGPLRYLVIAELAESETVQVSSLRHKSMPRSTERPTT